MSLEARRDSQATLVMTRTNSSTGEQRHKERLAMMRTNSSSGDQHYKDKTQAVVDLQPVETGRESNAAPQVPYLQQELAVASAFWPLAVFCVCSGCVGAIGFLATQNWLGFMSGALTQIGMDVAHLWADPATDPHRFGRPFTPADKQALVSFFIFAFASHLPRIFVPFFGTKSRRVLAMGTLLQALLTGFGALAVHLSGTSHYAMSRLEPSWNNASGYVGIGLISAGQGVQGTVAEWLQTPYGVTTVASSWFSQLGALDWSTLTALSHQPKRDFKVFGIFCIALGGMIGRGLAAAIGAPLALLLVAIAKMLTACSWLIVPIPR